MSLVGTAAPAFTLFDTARKPTSLESLRGSKVVIASYWARQLDEADAIALTVMARVGFNPHDTADALAAAATRLDDSSWPRDLRASSEHVAQIAQGPRPDKERVAQISGSAPPKLTYVVSDPSIGTAEPAAQARTQ